MSSSYSFRDRPRLSERLRGKSGDELFNELKKEFDQDRKSFFDRPPNWGSSAGSTFPRAANFFDDPLMRGHTDIRSHLEDLAQRHPEFADHLRYPAWSNESVNKSNTWGRKRRGSGESEPSEASKQQQHSQPQSESDNKEQAGSLRGRAKDNLRNTVPDMGQKQQQTEEKESRGQRSWSAPPPDSRNQQENKPRFVSKIEIHPVNPDAKTPQQSSSTGDATKPPMAPPKPQPQPSPQQQANQKPQQAQPNQQSTPQHKTSTVWHIPIFVEGRDEPLLPKVEPEFTQTQAPPQQHFTPPQQHFNPPQQHFNPTQQHYTHPQSHFHHPPRKQTPPRFEKEVPIQTRFEKEVPIQTRFEKEVPIQTRFEKEVPVQTRYEQNQHQPPQPQSQTQPQPQQPQVNPNDPLYRVELVQKEVDELKTRIENFNGTSRKDKEYIYLDEMLTRNLIKLDNIDTEGKEEVRNARKNTIKSIQNCISILENKVPVPNTENEGEQNVTEPEENVNKSEGNVIASKGENVEAMEVEQQQSGESNKSAEGDQLRGSGDSQSDQPSCVKSVEGEVDKPMEVEIPKELQEGNLNMSTAKEPTPPSEEKKDSTVSANKQETTEEKKESSSNEAPDNKTA